jgi:hypothetical protein
MGIGSILGGLAGGALGSFIGMPTLGASLGGALGGSLGGSKGGSAIFGSGPSATPMPFSQTSNGTTSGSSTGTSSGTSSGTSNNNFFGNTGGTSAGNFFGNTSGTTTSIAPEQYLPALLGMQPGAGGFNPAQQGAVDWTSRMLGSADPANMGLSMGYMDDALRNRTAPTLANLAASGNPAYATPADVVAQQGSKYMDSYRNPFEDQVVKSALGDLERQYGSTRNASNMQQAAAGAFGGGRQGIREAAMADDYLRTVGATSGGLRAQGFNTAAGLGMQDANRSLTADTFNNQQAQARNMFDSNLGMQYNTQRDALAGNLANMGAMNLGIGQDLASGLFDMGGAGQSQNLNWLSQFQPLFGQQNTGTTAGGETGTTTGTQTGGSTGTTTGATTGTTTGNITGTSTQMQPGSGGLVGSLGPILSGLGSLGWDPFGRDTPGGNKPSGGSSTGYVW